MKQKRAKWEPSSTSALCSQHFKPEDYVRRFNFIEGQSEPVIPRLICDEVGAVPIPTIHAKETNKSGEQADSHCAKRKVD